MRRIVTGIVLCIFVFSFGVAYGHPPQDIIITFDPMTKMLTAVIVHKVSNPLNHYIKKVDIELNGKEILSESFTHQENNLSQIVRYPVPDAKEGDTLSVEAYCSISGKLEKEIRAR